MEVQRVPQDGRVVPALYVCTVDGLTKGIKEKWEGFSVYKS